MLIAHSNYFAGEDVVDSAEIYEREEQKYVAEEKDFTQPQYFIAEEVGTKLTEFFKDLETKKMQLSVDEKLFMVYYCKESVTLSISISFSRSFILY